MLLGAVLLGVVALWSVLLGVVELGEVLLCGAELWSVAGGFTGALALSAWLPAGFDVVAAAAFALFASVDWLLPVTALLALLAALFAASAVWSAACWPAAAAPVAAPVTAPAAPETLLSVLLAWLLEQESEIMLIELTCKEPSLERVPWTWT